MVVMNMNIEMIKTVFEIVMPNLPPTFIYDIDNNGCYIYALGLSKLLILMGWIGLIILLRNFLNPSELVIVGQHKSDLNTFLKHFGVFGSTNSR